MIRSVPRPLLVSAILYLAASLACTMFPLVNYLGFEFSFVIALLGSILSGFTAIALFRSEASGGRPADGFLRTVLANASLLVIPLVVLSVNALFVRNCTFGEGLTFFILLPVVSVWFSTCLAFFLCAHCLHPKTMFVVVFGSTLLYAAALGYLTPAIHSYNLFYGYFPGLTYDEILGVSAPLLLYRLFTMFAGALLLWFGLLIRQEGDPDQSAVEKGFVLLRSLVSPRRRVRTIAIAITLGLIFLFRNELGFETHASFVRSELGSSVATDHVTVYYADSSLGRSEAIWLAAEHEFRLSQAEEFLQLPAGTRIESFIYPSVEEKRRLIGAGRTSIAKPWSGEMHLDAGSVRGVLKHEVVHLAAAPLGAPLIRASVLPGLTEGVAMAVEWEWGTQSLHEHSAAMVRHGVRPDMARIMGSFGFLRQASSVSYVLAGSFCRFLADRYGGAKLGRVYAWGDYEETYGEPLSALLERWYVMIDSVEAGEGDFDRVDLFFRSAPIFDRVCPRAAADKIARAGRLYGSGEFGEASALYRSAYEESGSMLARGGYLRSELRSGNTAPALAIPDDMRNDAAPGRYLPLLLTTGDALWLEGRNGEAADAFDRVACAELSRAYDEASLVRLLAIADGDSGEPVRALLLESVPDSARLQRLEALAAGRAAAYLRGTTNLRLGRYEAAAAALRNLDAGLRLEKYRLLSLGDALFRLRKFGEAEEQYRKAAQAGSSEGWRAEVQDRIDRVRWFTAMRMPDRLVEDLP